jgi:dTDP-glucose 4,6-dehydratase
MSTLTYAANPALLRTIEANTRYAFRRADICDRGADVANNPGIRSQRGAAPRCRIACRSLDRRPAQFIKTNIEGTYWLLEVALAHWQRLPGARADRFRRTRR